MKSPTTVSQGRIVCFVGSDGSEPDVSAAIVTKVLSEENAETTMVNVKVFFDAYQTDWKTSVPYDENKGPHTWHWPPKV